MFFSKSTGGFYDADLHGSRTLTVLTPGWVHPTIEVPDPEWVAADHVEGDAVPLVSILDPTVVPPTIEVPNPDCKIPADAVEITVELREVLSQGESAGKVITADANGYPMLTDPPPIPFSVLIDAAKAKVRNVRGPLFASLAGMQSQALANSDVATAKAISVIQDQLKVLPDADLSGCKTEADIDAKFAAAWLAIVAQVPQSVASAFKEVLS